MPKIRNPRFKDKAFTLLELMAVLAVVALLAGLLLPALARARSSAHRVQCLNQLRQLGVATQMYWDDHDSRAFRYRGAFTNGGDLYWFGWLERGAEGSRRFDPRAGALYPYLEGRGVEICPSLDRALRQFKSKATGAAYGYGYNIYLSAPGPEVPLDVQRLKHPSGTVLYADAAQVNTFQPPASPSNPMLEEFYYLSTNEATAHFRHRGQTQTVFCDGHTGGEKPALDSLDRRLPSQIIGRLQPELLAVP